MIRSKSAADCLNYIICTKPVFSADLYKSWINLHEFMCRADFKLKKTVLFVFDMKLDCHFVWQTSICLPLLSGAVLSPQGGTKISHVNIYIAYKSIWEFARHTHL